MLIGAAAARRQLVARGLAEPNGAACTVPALSARPLHLILACAVEALQLRMGDDTIFGRVGINTVIRQQQADAARWPPAS
jgi:hypothetical protein